MSAQDGHGLLAESAELTQQNEQEPNAHSPGLELFKDVLSAKNLHTVTLLHRGRFATVWQTKEQDGEVEYACKIVDVNGYSFYLQHCHSTMTYKNEIEILRECEHINILSDVEYIERPGWTLLMTKFMLGSSLVEHVNMLGSFAAEAGRRLVQQIGDALRYLRSQQILHRDIKPGNVLLTDCDRERMIVKLADFGFSRHCSNTQSCFTIIGTPEYMAPEMWQLRKRDNHAQSDGYTWTVDLWSFGLLLYAVFTGGEPFDDGIHSVSMGMTTFAYDEEEWSMLPIAKDFVQRLLTVSPSDRACMLGSTYNGEEIMDRRVARRLSGASVCDM